MSYPNGEAGRFARICGVRKLREPWADSRERAHEAACAEEVATRTAACGETAVELRLIDFVHVVKTIGGAIREGGVFDVFAEYAGALFVAASEEVAAGVMVRLGLVFWALLVVV